MRRLLLISLATISLAGCQVFNRKDAAVIDPVATIADGGTATGDPTAAAETFAEPTVETQLVVAAPDLIRSTDPNVRTRQINRNRVDPFATLPISPAPELVVVPTVEAAGSGASGSVESGGRNGGSAATTARSAARSSVAAARVSTASPRPPLRVQPNSAPLVNPIAALPAIPRPVIAPTISVSGVIQMGNEPYAILRIGSEPERYVRVGDRLAGGSVRVKRIETLAFEPRVILEENGIEVARPISTEPAAEPGGTPTDEPVAATPAATGSSAQANVPMLSFPRIPSLPSPAG